MFWNLKSGSTVPANASDFDVLYEGNGCQIDGDTVAWSELARVDVDESADRVSVTVWQRPNDDPRLPQDQDDCLGVAIGIPAHVKLAAPVGTRTIVDGFCTIDPSKAIDLSPDLNETVCDRVGISAP